VTQTRTSVALSRDEAGALRIAERVLPILSWLPRYKKSWLAADGLAALSVWALLVPQGLAYATIAGVPVEYGLYTALAALVAYAVFGTSRQLVQGPSASVAAVSAAVITPLVGTAALGTNAAVGYTAALALAAGAAYLALGALRMGWVSTFLSRAVMAGFVLGFSFGIIIDQLHKVLGVSKVEGTYAQVLWGTLKELPETSGVTLLIGGASLALLLGMRYAVPKLPRALIVMVLAIGATAAFDLSAHGLSITGDVPTGLPSIGLPGVGWSEATALAIGAFSVIFVGYSETLAAGRTMARKHGYELDSNQELVAEGMANGAAGFLGGFVSDGSLSKTSVADAAGQKTQLASLINAGLILLTLVALAGLFEDLPSATLGAVVIDAMVGLITFVELRRYYRVNRWDWAFFMAAGLGILFFGILQGILIGVVLSLLLLIARASQTSIRRLGRDPRSDTYLDIERHDALETTPGVVVARIDGPLFFADADRFRTRIKELVAAEEHPTAVVVDADGVFLTDTDGADILIQVAEELGRQGIVLALARVHPSTLELWRRAGVLDVVGGGVFTTVREAVASVTTRRTER
jgi:sulfate permease, SulP family